MQEEAESQSVVSSKPAPAGLCTLTVIAALACGKLAVMHTEGILVFRGVTSTATAQTQWYAVFPDGSFVVGTGSGSRTLRCNDGSTCEKLQKTASEGSGANASQDASIDWISTTLDGKRCAISLRSACEAQLVNAEKICDKVCLSCCSAAAIKSFFSIS
jgi:hypothetical protein